jgi:mannose/cellobiose epimerase-like protein (N-acyl-D-glucosamine 2-epimerase family)
MGTFLNVLRFSLFVTVLVFPLSAQTGTGNGDASNGSTNRSPEQLAENAGAGPTAYLPTSPYILNPETAIDFIRGIAAFRMKARDNRNGGFYTDINRQGYSTSSNIKALCGQSRIAYAFTRAFMVTGDEQYLEYAHHALKFLYDHGWNNGWYFVTDSAGGYINHWGHDNWWSFQQHYALVGITAMVEVTGGKINWNDGSQSDHTWLMRGINSNYTRLWDANPATKGYFNYANRAWTSKWDKGFTPTVDGVTTHGELMALMFDSLNHKQRLVELADNIVDYMVAALPSTGAGFPELFNDDWTIDYSNSNMDIGHGYKTAWVLQRAYLCNPSHTEYLTGAQALMQNLWDHGCYDTVYGAPYSYLNWQTGAVTSTNKDFWMTEQGLTSGLISYYTATTQAQRDMYMRVADGSINFFMNRIIDPVYGEAYSVVNRDGSSVVDASKGGLFTAGYHSTELGYYTYLYSSLYYHKTPVQLYYYYPAESGERTFKLTPIAIEDNLLKILDVTLNGVAYTDFNRDNRTIHLPAGTGGKFRVTFGFAPAVTHTITATAGTGGSISPSGTITVPEGNSQSFTFTSATGNRIADVLVDGVSVGTGSAYTFTNVIADHTIAAVFAAIPTYTITASAGEGGTITPSGATTIYENGSLTVTITPSLGYRIGGVVIDGVSAGAIASYTFSDVIADHSIAAVFEAVPTYTILASAGSGGSISPSGTITVSEGASQTFTITPSTGYNVSSVTVDGSSVGTVTTYTFTDITANHEISASFSIKSYTITASAGTGGSISPSGAVAVQHGSSQTFSMSPSSGYLIAGVLVDGISVGSPSSYTFSSVTAPHTISASFSVVSATAYKINCGGSASSPYTADQYYSGGTARTVTNTITTTGVTNPAPQAVYQAERYGTTTYTLPNLTIGGSYTVRLHFAELYWTATGKRTFTIAINGTTVLSNFDIYAITGARYKAVVREFNATANASGQMVIKFTTVTDNATIEGIEVISAIPNDPPTIATPAAASPNPVIASTTSLSVLGSDDNGESNLTYTWATAGTPPAAVTFSPNGTNAAKATIAAFSKAGSYSFQVTVTDQGGKMATSTTSVTVNQTFTSIALSPASATVNTGETRQFTSTARDQFAADLSTQPAFTWSVSGGGTISANGLFTAGTAAGGPFTVTAQSGALSGTASVTVTATPATVYQINCGGSASSPYTADQYYSGGTARTVTNTITTTGVTNPAPQAVYKAERYGTTTYTLPSLTSGAPYTVRLHFAELYWTATGKRVFNVLINGTTVLSNFDIYAAAGARYKAVVREFTATANSSGQIVVKFNTVTDNATIEGIQIIRQ